MLKRKRVAECVKYIIIKNLKTNELKFHKFTFTFYSTAFLDIL